ncbi:MAG: glutamine synthetase [Gammaproteobacteria bacterium]|nr:glutamine synthetase [Gammaproteobacteria bacterium]
MKSELQGFIEQCRTAGQASVLIGLTDLDGIIRGKYVDLKKLEQLMTAGGGFCDCVLGWDVDDHLYDFNAIGLDMEAPYTGWHTGFPDVKYRLIASSSRTVPATKVPFFLGEFLEDDSDFHPLCPRSLLRKANQLLSDQGITAVTGYEYEFFVANESVLGMIEHDYSKLRSVQRGKLGYSVLKAATNSSWLQEFQDYCREFDMSVEGLHFESDPGVWEAALNKRDALKSADCATLFKTFAKSFFRSKGFVATFMAKWSMNFPGQSGHFHFSFLDSNGDGVFSAHKKKLNDSCRFAIGGLVRYLPEWLPMLAPNVNSFTRLVPGAWAPTYASWGIENRTSAFRVIEDGNGGCHIENRVPGADSNPYLVGAATLLAASLGIRERIEPPKQVVGNAYAGHQTEKEQKFSPSLRDAAQRMMKSQSAHEVFGQKFVEHFVASRMWESHEAARNVTDWQLRRYFETI